MTFAEFLYAKYTWPTAPVKSMGVFRISANDGQTTITAVVLIDGTSYIVTDWELARTQ